MLPPKANPAALILPFCPFHQILDDPSGNSFVENPHAPQKDEALVVTHYRRTVAQAALLGIEVMCILIDTERFFSS